MPYNHQSEYNRFLAEWEKTFEFYVSGGMDLNEIWLMFIYDTERFNRERKFCEHTIPLPELEDNEDENAAALYRDYSNLITNDEEVAAGNRYDWIDSIQNPELLKLLNTLSSQDLELLTHIAIEGYSQAELARMQGCCRNVICKKYKKIKKYLARGLQTAFLAG